MEERIEVRGKDYVWFRGFDDGEDGDDNDDELFMWDGSPTNK